MERGARPAEFHAEVTAMPEQNRAHLSAEQILFARHQSLWSLPGLQSIVRRYLRRQANSEPAMQGDRQDDSDCMDATLNKDLKTLPLR